MKTTKKEIIKKMLLAELRSPEQIERIKSDEQIGCNLAIEWDLHSAIDDELISYADTVRMYNAFVALENGRTPFRGRTDKGYTHHILTPKAYLLLTAYKGSCGTLNKYSKRYKATYDGILHRNAWLKEYMDICNQLSTDINNEYQESNHKE